MRACVCMPQSCAAMQMAMRTGRRAKYCGEREMLGGSQNRRRACVTGNLIAGDGNSEAELRLVGRWCVTLRQDSGQIYLSHLQPWTVCPTAWRRSLWAICVPRRLGGHCTRPKADPVCSTIALERGTLPNTGCAYQNLRVQTICLTYVLFRQPWTAPCGSRIMHTWAA